MQNFKEIKEEILKRAKEADACEEQYKRAYKSENINELLNVVKDNFIWAYEKMNINAEFLEEYFGIEILKENHIYTSGENSIELDNVNMRIYVLGNAFVNVKTYYNSSANVETLNNSSANVETYDNSSANVETYNSSSANVRTYHNSSKLIFEVIGENSFIRQHNERKIYVKKDNFEIVEL